MAADLFFFFLLDILFRDGLQKILEGLDEADEVEEEPSLLIFTAFVAPFVGLEAPFTGLKCSNCKAIRQDH